MTRQLREFWIKVLNGDQEAWSKIVERYASLVYAAARRCGLSAPDVEDCAQFTWMALYRNRSRIRDPLKIPAWLISTARRRAISMLRQQSQQIDFPELNEMMETQALPDEELLRLERLDILQHAMEQLDERCQRLLMALFLSPETMSYNEIAKTLKISPNAMGPLRSRCLTRLRKILDEMGYLLH